MNTEAIRTAEMRLAMVEHAVDRLPPDDARESIQRHLLALRSALMDLNEVRRRRRTDVLITVKS
jgi:hypothetical protein